MVRFRNVSNSAFGLVSAAGALGAILLAGCAANSPDLSVPAADYAVTFTAARDVLHSYRFPLDRVDARAGVLTTHPKPSSGFFTPWDTEQSTISQEWEDTINQQRRRVDIVFTPVAPIIASPGLALDTASATPPDSSAQTPLAPNGARDINSDLLEKPVDTNLRVLVTVERIYQFGWRPNTKSVHLTTLSDNPQASSTRYEVDISDDPPLAGRIAAAIKQRAAAIVRTKQTAEARASAAEVVAQ